MSQVGMDTVEEPHAPCEQVASVLGSPACPSMATLSCGEACAKAAQSYFAVGEGCALIYSGITGQQQHTATVPHLQGLEHFISGASSHQSQIVPFITVWDVLVRGCCSALPCGREKSKGLYLRHATATYS